MFLECSETLLWYNPREFHSGQHLWKRLQNTEPGDSSLLETKRETKQWIARPIVDPCVGPGGKSMAHLLWVASIYTFPIVLSDAVLTSCVHIRLSCRTVRCCIDKYRSQKKSVWFLASKLSSPPHDPVQSFTDNWGILAYFGAILKTLSEFVLNIFFLWVSSGGDDFLVQLLAQENVSRSHLPASVHPFPILSISSWQLGNLGNAFREDDSTISEQFHCHQNIQVTSVSSLLRSVKSYSYISRHLIQSTFQHFPGQMPY